MSTKTTFKRVALVTVAAMGFGLLSVVPSTATSQQDTLTLGSATTTSAGSALTNTIKQTFLGVNSDTMSVTATLTSMPAGNVAMPVLSVLRGPQLGQSEVSTDALTGWLADTGSVGTYHSSSSKYNVAFTPTVKGTYVVTFAAYNMSSTTARTTVAAQAAAVTWTVTVSSGTVADTTSTSIMSKGIAVSSGSGTGAGVTDEPVVVAANTGSAVALIVVTPLTASAASTGSTTVTAVLTGTGNLSINTSAAPVYTGARTVTQTAVGAAYIYVYGDGTTGTGTITITQGTNTFTETVKFYGAAASVTSTLKIPVIHSGSGAATTAGVISATVLDAAGNAVPGVTVYAISGTTTAMASSSATTGSSGIALISLKGLVAGTSAITVQNVATGSTATYSAAALSVRAGDNVGTSVTMTLDKATYAQGEAAILTVTAKDAAGNLVAPGTVAVFTSAGAICSRACTGATLPGASHVTTGSANGSVTYAINVPATSGAFTISATQGADMLNAGSAISVSATVSPSAAETAAAAAIAAAADIASAAVDAAAEATDAANAATDAANAAAEAADAATAAAQDAADAVASLATAVTELMADLKAQIAAQKAAITALTNLVIKIQKKIKA